MIERNKIYNMDCIEGMMKMNNESVDLILTSPPYNTGRNSGSMENHEKRYDIYLEKRNNSEYNNWTVKIFEQFDRVLKKDGCVLYNMSYGGENPMQMYETIMTVCENTDFMVADTLIWKKKSALPNNVSHNKLTRICEFVFVFCRKDEYKTFRMNKFVKSVSKTGQKYYENVFNFLEAKNNDGPNKLNKATFSTEFVEKLLGMYAIKGYTVLDPFMGTGTTAVACVNKGMDFIGFELSQNQCEYANDRLGDTSEDEAWGEDL